MKIDILTLFPKMFENVLNESMLKIAQGLKKVNITVYNIRNWAYDRHRTADDKPYGGGSGMVMKIEPIHRALTSLLGKNRVRKLRQRKGITKKIKVVLLTPKGRRFNQGLAKMLSKTNHIILISGHYGGIDERVRLLVTDEISIGDYVMTGGEIPAMVILDTVIRLIPGVLGDSSSLRYESFENNLLEYPHYTRPREFEGMKVPDVLLSGDHKAIEKWCRIEALKSTKEMRSDLLNEAVPHHFPPHSQESGGG